MILSTGGFRSSGSVKLYNACHVITARDYGRMAR